MLNIITEHKKIIEYHERFIERMNMFEHDKYTASIGFQGGSRIETVNYYKNIGFWFTSSTDVENENRYWNPFGLENPESNKKNLSPVVEINIPFGLDRKIQGVFLVGENNKIYIGHRGVVNGVKKELFFDHYTGPIIFADDDGQDSKIAIISPLESEHLLFSLKTFFDKVETIKKKIKNKLNDEQKNNFSFKPKKESRKPYIINEIIEAGQIHAIVVNELGRQLKNNNYEINETQQIDLMIYSKNDVSHIFEAKSNCDSQSIYTAIGQLMYHSLNYQSAKKILVIPYGLDEEQEMNINRLGIQILHFVITQQDITFSSFGEIGLTPYPQN